MKENIRFSVKIKQKTVIAVKHEDEGLNPANSDIKLTFAYDFIESFSVKLN